MLALSTGVGVSPGPVNCGIIFRGQEALVIDTGLDKDAARKLLAAVGDKTLKVIINTHAHADHFGGNDFLTKRTGAEVWANRVEGACMNNPMFEPYFLTAGSSPVKELDNRFFLAPRSIPQRELTAGEKIEDWGLEIIDLPGHTIAQIGVKYKDICFAGDAFLGAEYLNKHQIPFNVNITRQLQTLEFLASLPCEWFVPAHGEPRHKPELLRDLEANRDRIEKIMEMVVKSVAQGPLGLEEITRRVADGFQLTINTPGQFYLYRTAISAYLAHLREKGIVEPLMQDNYFLWERVMF